MNDLGTLDATGLAKLVKRGEVTPTELLERAIARVDATNAEMNAVVTPMYDEAEAAIALGLPDGPFAGVPYLLKDLLATYAGVRMTGGSRMLADYVPGFDSELVVRLKRAGLVIFGKTNTPELGILPTTEPELLGKCKNPWSLDHTTGGSSGGSAAAVAAGVVPMAHANDGGGSIRIPASCCGVFGLKPTRARNPLGPHVGDIMSGLVVEHAVTRSVRDSARLLDATQGADLGAPYVAPAAPRPYSEEVQRDPPKLRIAFTTRALTGAPIHPDCVRAVEDAAALCVDLGHEVLEGAPDLDGPTILQAFLTVWSAGTAMDLKQLEILTGSLDRHRLEPLTWALADMGRAVSGADYLLAVAQLRAVSRRIARFMERVDVWLTPTLAAPPLPLGSFDPEPDNPLAGMMRATDWVPFTPLCNFSGQPAMSVPLFWNEDGLPVGTHFAGRFGDEGTLFSLAGQLERARPWADKRPPIRAP